jgi:hypothetical protein
MTILPFLEGTSFPPEVVAILGDAYEGARRSLHDTGQPHLVKEVIAKRIIHLAAQGERDPKNLCEQALAGLGIHNKSE